MGINKDQVEGRAKEAGGKVQQAFGKMTGSSKEQLKGATKQVIGAGQAAAGDAAEKLKNMSKKR
jgi:uncharacterized protein YjbJ (UPF0337 family)